MRFAPNSTAFSAFQRSAENKGKRRLWLPVALGGSLLFGACLASLAPEEPAFRLAPPWVALGDSDSAQLYLVLPSGDTLPAAAVSWSSSDPSVAQVSADGIVHSLRRGSTRITGSGGTTHGTFSGMSQVVVVPAVLVGAGDIGECGSDGPTTTGDLVARIAGVVFAAGDNAYPDGSSADYASCYAPTWGRERERTRPTAGNHDYHTVDAAGYYDYFGANAGDRGTGYYSYRLGTWHVIVLNSNIPFGPSSVQQAWLRDDLAQHSSSCSLAYWHHPLFSSGREGSDTSLASLWQLLEQGGTDVAITGHDHDYERFAPQLSDGRPDARGIREFVVGTGGGSLFPMRAPTPNSEKQIGGEFGVLTLALLPGSYHWSFLRAPDGATLDSGTTPCH